MSRIHYELANVESPFAWRSKFALAHKGLAYESRRTAFTDIPTICEGRHKTVPVLVDEDGTETCDSMAIATYLDDKYESASPLLGGERQARTEEIEGLLGAHGFKAFFPLFILDIYNGLPEKDASYFRESREKRFGATLEDLSANRDERLPAAREGMQPLRDALGDKQWYNGDNPGYTDYVVLAFFAWLKGCAKTPPLAAGDPLQDYVERGFALYDGLGNTIQGGPLAA